MRAILIGLSSRGTTDAWTGTSCSTAGLSAWPYAGAARRTWTGCGARLAELEMAGVSILIPAVIDYEVRRELVRSGRRPNFKSWRNCRTFPILPVSGAAWFRAAEFWALSRRMGLPTGSDAALDADAVLAGCAATVGRPGDEVVIASSNVRHLSRFPGIDAQGVDLHHALRASETSTALLHGRRGRAMSARSRSAGAARRPGGAGRKRTPHPGHPSVGPRMPRPGGAVRPSSAGGTHGRGRRPEKT